MAPIKVNVEQGNQRYSIPFLGDLDERMSESLDISSLDGSDWIDEDGYIKSGTPLQLNAQTLTPIDGADQTVRGCVLETTKVAESNATADLTGEQDIVIVVQGTIDKAILESSKGSALSANEQTGFDNNDSLVLTDPVS